MRILGIDTCTETIDAALFIDGKTASSRRGSAPRQQLTKLIPFIKEIMEESGESLENLDLIAVTSGPGSFTGIRLGIATVKTLAQINNTPVASINTLDAIAAGCPEDGIIIPSIDARKSEIFYGVYKKNEDKIENLGEYKRSKVDDYISFVNSLTYDNIIITGSMLARYGDIFKDQVKKNYKTTDEYLWTPKGETVAKMGEIILKNNKSINYKHLQADYMRPSDAVPPAPLM